MLKKLYPVYCEYKLSKFINGSNETTDIETDRKPSSRSDEEYEKKGLYNPYKNNTEYVSLDDLKKIDLVTKIELLPDAIGGHHSHFGHKFDKNGVIRTFAYRKGDSFAIVKLNVFYCESCGKYFDVKTSYAEQLRKHGISIDDMIVKHEGHTSSAKNPNIVLKDQSKLRLLGYSVGVNGCTTGYRHKIIDFALESGYMTVYEIKNLLDYLITFNGSASNMGNAVKQWKEDLNYLNTIACKKIR